MILAGYQHLAGGQLLHRMVAAVVAELHLHRLRAGGQGQELVAQTNAESGRAGGHDLPDGVDGVVAGVRVAGAIGQKHAVGLAGQDRLRRRGGGHHLQFATQIVQNPQDVALHAEIEGDDLPALFRLGRRGGSLQGPDAALPAVRLLCGHLPGQIQALQSGKVPGQLEGPFRVQGRGRPLFRLARGEDATRLGPLVPE